MPSLGSKPKRIQRSKLQELRNAVADYIRTEGCSCCRDTDAHDLAKERLGKLLRVPPYKDGSGRDFNKFATNRIQI